RCPAPTNEILRAGIGAHRAGGQRESRRVRDDGAHRRVLRGQPGVQARRRRGRRRRDKYRLVRYEIATSQRLGVGTVVSRERRDRGRGQGRSRTHAAVRAGDPHARTAARYLQVPVQRNHLGDREPTMSVRSNLSQKLLTVWNGDPWYGSSSSAIFKGVTAAGAPG